MKRASKWLALLAAASGVLAVAAGCSSDDADVAVDVLPADPVEAGIVRPGFDKIDEPVGGLSDDDKAGARRGDDLFATSFRESDGLGPLYIRAACSSCHESALRGPGSVEKFAFVGADGVTPLADQSALPYGHSTRPLLTHGAKTQVRPQSPDGGTVVTMPLMLADSGADADATPASDGGIVGTLRISQRLGPSLLGLGYIEAIDESEIRRIADLQCKSQSAICGKPQRVVYASMKSADLRFHASTQGARVIGRFGVKARIGFIDDMIADALVNDLGLTSPLRPKELPNPDDMDDDGKPGVDLSVEAVGALATYVRTLAIPRRINTGLRGSNAFVRVGCATCHVPSMHTRADYPIKALADIDAAVYTDVLVHDMGDFLADGMTDGPPRGYRTAPLIAMRFQRNFLHDGRVKTVEDAIAAHDAPGSEARDTARAFAALSPEDRAALVTFVKGL